MFLIDTNTISYFYRKNPQVASKFQSHSEKIHFCVISKMESIFGAKKNDNQILVDFYNDIYNAYPLLSFDSDCVEIFCDTKVFLSNQGKIVEDFDLMIASIALANNLTLVTNNTKHFINIPDLKVVDWSK
jgi:tRNA(fMet)-specific endonuclease VapC